MSRITVMTLELMSSLCIITVVCKCVESWSRNVGEAIGGEVLINQSTVSHNPFDNCVRQLVSRRRTNCPTLCHAGLT